MFILLVMVIFVDLVEETGSPARAQYNRGLNIIASTYISSTSLIYEVKEPVHEVLEHRDLLTTRGTRKNISCVCSLFPTVHVAPLRLSTVHIRHSVEGGTGVAFVAVVGICVLNAWCSCSGAQFMAW